jgi:hypothetical protein
VLESVDSWLRELATWHEAAPNVDEVYLPFPSKKLVYERYMADAARRPSAGVSVDIRPATYPAFVKAWAASVPHIKCRKQVCLQWRTGVIAGCNNDAVPQQAYVVFRVADGIHSL